MGKEDRNLIFAGCSALITCVIVFSFVQHQMDRRAAIEAIENIGNIGKKSVEDFKNKRIRIVTLENERLKKSNAILIANNRLLMKENKRVLSEYSFELSREKQKMEYSWNTDNKRREHTKRKAEAKKEKYSWSEESKLIELEKRKEEAKERIRQRDIKRRSKSLKGLN